MPEERKLVTVLFADIVGSTALTTSNQPEVVRDMMSRTFARMSAIVRQHGGTVEKFAGDEVMAVFGAPIAHENDADRGVRVAFALRDAVNRLPTGTLRLRIGLNTGEVLATSEVRDQQLVTGQPVIAAARLRAAAKPDEILVGALTRQLTEADVRYGRKRRVRAKGLGTIEASTAEALLSAVPQQHRGASRLRSPMIGRDEELRMLADIHRRVRVEGRPGLVTVFGPAGAGKSRLVHEFVETIGVDSVLRGRCLPYGEGITFWPLQEMLRSAAGIVGDDSRDDANRKLRSAVAAVFGTTPEDADASTRRLAVLLGIQSPEEALPGIRPDSVRDEMRWALRRFFAGRAKAFPLTLVFEDIHWAEATLLDIIEDLVDSTHSPICVLCLARPELLAARPSWGREKPTATSVVLEPLSADQTLRLISELLRIEDLPEDLRRALVANAEGNPLYVEEFLRMLIDTGGVERRGRRWIAMPTVASLAVPPTIQGLIAARLDLLDDPVKQAVQAAAAIGRVFWSDALIGLGQPVNDLGRRLAIAEERDLVVQIDERGLTGGTGYRFKHVLVRDVAYRAIHKGERLRLHDVFTAWLEHAAGARGTEYIDVIAHHSEQAFILATELGAPQVGSLGRRAFAHLRAAIVRARFHGDRRAVLSLCERAQVVATGAGIDEVERGEVAGIAALTRYFVASTPPNLAALESSLVALRRVGTSALLVRALTFVARGYVVVRNDRGRALALYDEALDRARDLGDPDYIVEAMVQRHELPKSIGDEDEVLRILTDAYEYMQANHVRAAEGSPIPRLAFIAALRGEFTKAAALREEHAALAKGTGSRMSESWFLDSQLNEALQLGDYARAASVGTQLLALQGEIGDQGSIAGAMGQLGDALHGRGDFNGARAAQAKALELLEPLADAGQEPEVLWRLSRDALSLGNIDEAEGFAQRACEKVLPDDVFSRASTRLQLAEVRAAQGRVDEAERLFRDGLEILDGTRYDQTAADARRAYSEFLIGRNRFREAGLLLLRARDFYKDPLAFRQRERIEALLERVQVATDRGA